MLERTGRRPANHGRALGAAEQRCWNHKILEVLDKQPKREHAQSKLILCGIPYAENRSEAERGERVLNCLLCILDIRTS